MSNIMSLGKLISIFIKEYLINERNLSKNSIASYCECIKLLLCFASGSLKLSIDKLTIECITQTLILRFLDHLESERNNGISTRNQRLAIIKTFIRYAARQVPEILENCEQICAICKKNAPKKIMETLSDKEVQAIISSIKNDTLHNVRDRTMLMLLYNTGARAQEIADLNIDDVRLDQPFQIRITGKGSKERIVPLDEQTINQIKRFLEIREQQGVSDTALFLSDKGARLTRFGIRYIVKKRVGNTAHTTTSLKNRSISTHTFRHTTALHLIQSDVDISIVKNWLGHADIKTTSMYIDINTEMKRQALEKAPLPMFSEVKEQPNWRTSDIMKLLAMLSKRSALC